MTSSGPISIDDTNNGRRPSRANKLIILTIGVSVIVGLTILSLSVATLVKVNEGFKQNQVKEPLVNDSSLLTLASSIQVDEVMIHLKELQRIADISDGNRAVRRPGFNRTIDYIFKYLESNTDHIVTKRFFSIRQFQLTSNPILVSSINGTIRNYTFSENLSTADFYSIELSTRADFSSFIPVTTIPNLGCSDADWQSANPPPAGRIALVKRGICTHVEKGQIAMRYNVSGLLIYNDGATPDRVSPISISLGQENEVPALYLSAPVGQALADAVRNPANTVSVQMVIDLLDLPLTPIGNICADTKTGDATRTIIIGSHSDSVPAGPGINDNGSGSAANLALAASLSRLFRTPAYLKYKYRVRFCWFGAEEIGLLGSEDLVKQAKIATAVGERVQDYLINLNFDMIASPNFMFGIYDAKTANNDTPAQVLPGSTKITAEFVEWFKQERLPWNYTDFSGRSDYGPFLAEGIVAGGLYSGGDDTKSQDERDYYAQMLGTSLGGLAGIVHDPCYHQACDSIENINVFALEKMTRAAAHMLEYLARQDDLNAWLYPNGRVSFSKNSIFKTKFGRKNFPL